MVRYAIHYDFLLFCFSQPIFFPLGFFVHIFLKRFGFFLALYFVNWLNMAGSVVWYNVVCNTHWIDGQVDDFNPLDCRIVFNSPLCVCFSIWNQKSRKERKKENICKQIKWTFSWVHLTGATRRRKRSRRKKRNGWNNSRCNCLMLIRKLTIANVPRFCNIGQLHTRPLFFVLCSAEGKFSI